MLQKYCINNYNVLMKQNKPIESISYFEKCLLYVTSDKEKYFVNVNLGECFLYMV